MTKELALEIAEGFASAAKENEGEGFPRMAERLALADRSIRACLEAAKPESWASMKIGEHDEWDDMMSDYSPVLRNAEQAERNGFEFFERAISGEQWQR
jgi:hypothetical protein